MPSVQGVVADVADEPMSAEILAEVSRTDPLGALPGVTTRRSSHDTSRHTIRSTVECSACGRHLRGAMNSHGKWVVGKHKGCIGHLLGGHKEVRT